MTANDATYRVRTMRDGIIGWVNHGVDDIEDAQATYDMWERYFLNLPDPALASGLTLQLIAPDDTVPREVTFP